MNPHHDPRKTPAGPGRGQDKAATGNGQDYLTPAQFADTMGVNTRTVRNWIKTDYIQATRVGPRLIRIPTSELQRIAVPLRDNTLRRPSR
jgi:excisionase family DNA binding protein